MKKLEDYDRIEYEQEYETIRNGIEKKKSHAMSITALAAPIALTVLFTACKMGQRALVLINFGLILAMLGKEVKFRESIMRGGTYSLVFLEPVIQRKWETRLFELEKREKEKRQKKRMAERLRFFEWVMIYVVSLIVLLVLMENAYPGDNLCDRIDKAGWEAFLELAAAAITGILMYILIKNCGNTVARKEEYIEAWKEVAKKEKKRGK